MKLIFSTCFIFIFTLIFASNPTNGIDIKCPASLSIDDPLAYLYQPNNNNFELRVRIVRKDNVTFSVDQIDDIADVLESGFDGTGITFAIDCKVYTEAEIADNVDNAINVTIFAGYVASNSRTSPSVFIDIGEFDVVSPVLIHEMGHAFGLLHTYNSAISANTKLGEATCEELVNNEPE